MATHTVTKGKVGVEDIQFWASGAPTYSYTTSTGGSGTKNAVSAADLPVEDAGGLFTATTAEAALAEAKGCFSANDTIQVASGSIQTLATAANAELLSTASETHVLGGFIVVSTDDDPTAMKLGITIDGGSEVTADAIESSATSEKRHVIPGLYGASSMLIRLKNTTGVTITYAYQIWYRSA